MVFVLRLVSSEALEIFVVVTPAAKLRGLARFWKRRALVPEKLLPRNLRRLLPVLGAPASEDESPRAAVAHMDDSGRKIAVTVRT